MKKTERKNYLRQKTQKLWEEVKIHNIFLSIARKRNDHSSIKELLEKRNLIKAEIAYINYSVR